MVSSKPDTLVVGGGLAGLARLLQWPRRQLYFGAAGAVAALVLAALLLPTLTQARAQEGAV